MKRIKITVEGVPNCGRSVVASQILASLRAAGFQSVMTDAEPDQYTEIEGKPEYNISMGKLAMEVVVSVVTADPAPVPVPAPEVKPEPTQTPSVPVPEAAKE